MTLNNVHDLFEMELMTVLASERAALKAIDEMISETREPVLRQGMEKHRRETEGQIQRLEQVAKGLNVKVKTVTPHVFEGIVAHKRAVMQMDPIPEVLELVNLDASFKIEHLEISAYNGLIQWAEAMGAQDLVEPLRQNLREEEAMLQQLIQFSQKGQKTVSGGQKSATTGSSGSSSQSSGGKTR